MPYIIETSTPRYHSAFSREVPHLTHTAVATLDEARENVHTLLSHADADLNDMAPFFPVERSVPEGGGTITVGPLPDGTVIEVKRVDWMDFERMVVPGPVAACVPITTFDDDDYRDNLIVAFNAQH